MLHLEGPGRRLQRDFQELSASGDDLRIPRDDDVYLGVIKVRKGQRNFKERC